MTSLPRNPRTCNGRASCHTANEQVGRFPPGLGSTREPGPSRHPGCPSAVLLTAAAPSQAEPSLLPREGPQPRSSGPNTLLSPSLFAHVCGPAGLVFLLPLIARFMSRREDPKPGSPLLLRCRRSIRAWRACHSAHGHGPLCLGPGRAPGTEQAPRSNAAGHPPSVPGSSITEPMVVGMKAKQKLDAQTY